MRRVGRWLGWGLLVLGVGLVLVWLILPGWYLAVRYIPYGTMADYSTVFKLKQNDLFRELYRRFWVKPAAIVCPGCINNLIYPMNVGRLRVVDKDKDGWEANFVCGELPDGYEGILGGTDAININVKPAWGPAVKLEADKTQAGVLLPSEFSRENLAVVYKNVTWGEIRERVNKKVCARYWHDPGTGQDLLISLTFLPTDAFINQWIKPKL